MYYLYVGDIEGCSNNHSIYSTDPEVPRCSEYSWLINILFAVYILVIGIMLLNVLIAIFTYVLRLSLFLSVVL